MIKLEWNALRLLRPRGRTLLAGLVLLVVWLPGCDDGVAPPDVTGRYRLERVSGSALPYLWTDGPFTDEWLDSASITLRSDGEFQSVAHWRTTYANGNPDSRVTYPVEGRYRQLRGRIEFSVDGEWWASASHLEASGFTLIGENFVEQVFRR